jgi:endonuclease YncB( thermonuclease family)
MRARPRQLVGAGLSVMLVAGSPAGAASSSPGQPSASTQPRAAGDPPAPPATAGPASRDAGPAPAERRGFLIYLKDGTEPIVVDRYTEEQGQVRFQKYGGWIGIPVSEILKIVPDEPAPQIAAEEPPAPAPEGEPAPAGQQSELHVTLRTGGTIKATAVAPDGERLRITVPDGSFTVPRSDVVALVRVTPGTEMAEAWISIVATHRPDETAVRAESPSPLDGTGPHEAAARPAETAHPVAPDAAASQPTAARLPYERSDRAHFVRLQNGQLMRLDGFWVEAGELRFQRFGGIIGLALAEVVRLIPEEIAPVPGRTQVRFVRQLGPDLLEVAVKSGPQGVRLLGIAPVDLARSEDSPWRRLDSGAIVHLEFDRQRYDAEGNWLAYVFLPNNRMLNAELIRLGLARPLADARNLRYLDLFHELATGELPEGVAAAAK